MNSAGIRRGIGLVSVLALMVVSGVLSGWPGHSQAAPEAELPQVPATTVATMDVGFIFKNHKAFTDQMKVLEQRAQAFQRNQAGTEAQLQLLKGRMEQSADKAEKEKLEAEFARQGAEYQLFVRTNQRDLLEAEAKIYYETYLLLEAETKKYCRSRGIQVVLKAGREPIKADDRNSVMQGLNRPIVFSDAPDITDDIVKVLDLAAEAKSAAAAKGNKDSTP
jgi:hypothetical protein